ncbi:MAG: RNA 2',3'-cyclic phosphodiesterase [Gaiellaceae bacterium]
MAGGEKLRLFCAYPLPPASVAEIAAWQHEHLRGPAGQGARLVPPENLHVTLAFLGSRPAGDVPAIGRALADAAAGSGPSALQPVSFRQGRGVGMIVCNDAAGTAGAFAAEVAERLEALGVYRREARAWLPHVTVLRSKRGGGASLPVANIRSINVVRAALYASALRPTGAHYDVLETVALGGR